VEELSVDLKWPQFQHLHFRLTAPNTRAEQSVRRGREDRFGAVKRYFGNFIRDCIKDTTGNETVFAEIDIELLADGHSARKWWTDKDIIDFDW
jgi:hypothetical protein